MVTGDQLLIGKEVARQLGMGTNMYTTDVLIKVRTAAARLLAIPSGPQSALRLWLSACLHGFLTMPACHSRIQLFASVLACVSRDISLDFSLHKPHCHLLQQSSGSCQMVQLYTPSSRALRCRGVVHRAGT